MQSTAASHVEGLGAMSEGNLDAHDIYWVYMRNSARSWTVGFYDRKGHWRHQRNCSTQEAAAAYVNKLNSSRARIRVKNALVGLDLQGKRA